YLFLGGTMCVCASAARGDSMKAAANSNADIRPARFLPIVIILIPSAARAPRLQGAANSHYAKVKSGTNPSPLYAGGRAARQASLPSGRSLSKPPQLVAQEARESGNFFAGARRRFFRRTHGPDPAEF